MKLRLLAALVLLAGCVPAAPDYSRPAGVHEAPQASNYMAPPGYYNPQATQQAAPAGSALSEQRTVKVGLLLPLTGRNAELGRALQDAATIALFDRYARLPSVPPVKVELVPKDTGDAPEQAAAAMRSAIADGAVFVIGPVFSDATEAAAPIARQAHVAVLSFSNNSALARPGVYPFGFSPQEQTRRVVAYAVRAGKTKIAALVPDSVLGQTVLATAKETLAANGIALAAEAHYAPAGVGIDRAAGQLAPPGAPPAFDTLLLPEGGASLPTMLRALAQHGIAPPKVQLIGTGIWDDETLVHRTGLDGAWLASSSPGGTQAFETRFVDTYKYAPPRVASLAYDAVSLAVTLATSDRGFTEASLTSPSGFAGPANGIFRLRPDGKVERGLAVLQIEGSDFTVLDPSPSNFSAPAAGPSAY
ncbi:MAG: penicillin-binding protein activator [Alphaproteobacteria bacterium]